MSDNTYSISEIVGTSTEGVEQAIDNGLTRMSKTIKNLDWFEVVSVRGQIDDSGGVAFYQVTVKVGFRMEG
jgi:flavin-binding protein dodecin